MAEYDLVQDVNVGRKPKEVKEQASTGPDHTTVSRAIEQGRPEAIGPQGALHLQRAAGNAAMGALVQRSEEESPVHKVVGKGGGSSLDDGVRKKMESSLGYDFSGVRVHTGGDAAAAAKSVQAQAFTVGNDVVFNEGKYSPSSPEGQRTIAHELTHVVQQSQGEVPGESRGGGVKVSDPSDWAEQQAEATADSVMAGGGGGDHAGHDHAGSGGGASVQALPLQRAGDEQEEEVQTLREANVQRAGDEQEEEVQTLPEANVQRAEAGPDEREDEEVQTLPETNLQRQEEEETPEEG
ncbi:MAG: DUF4157 domain-containing protein [Actinobacteria bacterium]|nr:DUF4157 domain-containing protein [Actinomycetota bacterium]MBW3649194.1 DUF4157 domain-containing protein [Actinomycetota bacterium]